MTINVQTMVRGYIEAMELTDCLSEGDDECYGKEWSPELLESIPVVCARFIAACGEPLLGALAELAPDYDDEQFGCDFWLTRNGHGAGFWDRDELNLIAFPAAVITATLGNLLTAQAKRFGEVSLYVGDDDLVYA